MDPSKEKEVEDEYLSSLMDLNVNSKPLINMLTMLAEDNMECATVIVRAIEKHITQAAPDAKLPILYLIDSIVKNVGDKYKPLFAQNIVSIFCEVFKKVNEKIREKMFNLRQTWNEVFPQPKLYTLDVKVNMIDQNWPITAKVVPKSAQVKPKSVHVNPNFLKKDPEASKAVVAQVTGDMNFEDLESKERELMALKRRKIELELLVVGKKIVEREKEVQKQFGVPPPRTGLSIAPPQNNQLMAGMKIPPPNIGPPQNRIRIAPVSAAAMAAARSRDPRLLKMGNQMGDSSNKQQELTGMPLAQQPSSLRGLPRIPKFNKSPSTTREDREESRKRREKESEEKSNSSSHRSKSSSKSSPSKKSSHESSRKRDDDRKSSKSSHKSSSSRLHSSSSKSPSKNSDDATKDIDLRVLVGDIDMRPDSTTAAAAVAESKANKNKLLNELLHDEDMRSTSQDSMISTSNDNEDSDQIPKCDTDLRFTEQQPKKRSMSGEPSDVEPNTKKNRVDNNLALFGNQDVDLRDPGNDMQSDKKLKSTALTTDLATVRLKLQASKARNKLNSIKILDVPPLIENGTSEIVKKILQKKKGDSKDQDDDHHMEQQSSTMNAMPDQHIALKPNPRKEKRKESKWSQPTVAPSMPWMNNNPVRVQTNQMTTMMPHHFNNPWEAHPMVIAMQKASQMPLVIPQSSQQLVLNNKMRTLRLDGTRDHLLRFYGEVAIIFNESGQAHDIRFSSGQSKVVIDDTYSALLNFNDTYKPIFIDGVQHKIKFGTPTRELYIDDNFYECYFNNQTTQIVLGDKVRRVRIEGKAPEVKIGQPRRDIVLGLINMMIDAEIVVPVFLDTTEQYFEYKNQIFSLQFADFFLSVVINNEPFKVEFGGLPRNYSLNGQKHFIRFTVLPDDISPGHVNLRGMRRTNLFRNCKSPPIIEGPGIDRIDINRLVENDMQQPIAPVQTQPARTDEGSMNISELLQKLVATGIIGNTATTQASNSKPTIAPVVIPAIIKPQLDKKDIAVKPEEGVRINPINLLRPETIKARQHAIVDTLYIGIQCGSCGLRFPPEQTIRYSQHLDWHFRQNRRERDSKRKAQSRRWYYNRSDWIKYEEIEDADEREKNFFETQQMEAMDQGEDSNMGRSSNNQESSCPAGADDVNRCCDMCHDQFDQFFNEETEEWHLKSAIRVEDKFFHPICYEDFKTSLTLDESGINADNTSQTNEEDIMEINDSVVIKEEKPDELFTNNSEVNPDDDDVILMPPEEPVITEIQDEVEENEEQLSAYQILNATDDDVQIQEPKIETHRVYDDDEQQPDNLVEPEFTHKPMIVTIKEEPKDDGYGDLINEEDAFVEVTSINEDLINDETHSPFHPSTFDENAMFDDSSLMMMSNVDDEQNLSDDGNSRPDSSSAPAVVGGTKKLKIVLSSAALVQQSNLKNSNVNNNNLNNVNDQTESSSNFESVNKLDSNSLVDLQKEGATASVAEQVRQEEKELEYVVKPHLRDFKFERNSVPVKRGFENSGLCSIM